jgi:hypothetical protein
MPRQPILLVQAAFFTLALGAQVIAAELSSEASAYLEQAIARKVPQNWQVHVSRRGDDLIAFFMPPYQEAFDLWYEPDQLREKMLSLCPSNDDTIWRRLAPGQNIMFQPTVGGKSTEAMRLTCPRSQTPPA